LYFSDEISILASLLFFAEGHLMIAAVSSTIPDVTTGARPAKT